MQKARDEARGLNTAGYVSGYRGSPLGGLDQQFERAKKLLDPHHIVFVPGLNEDLAATALWGTQQAEMRGEGAYDGVFGMWYGKGPGVDRCGDVFRHANAAGTSKHGGVLVLMGGLMQINPVWTYGPYNPSEVTAGAQPDWYMGFVEGGIRIMPNWEWHIGSTTWSWNIAIPGLGLLGLLAVVLAAYPFVEQWITGDKKEHHLLDRPRDNATRTAFGVAAIACYGMLWIGGGNDIVATQFHVSLNHVTYFLRVAVFVAPVIAYHVTKRICVGLQRADEERLLHGAESGVLVRDPSGSYSEKHIPISTDEAFTPEPRSEDDKPENKAQENGQPKTAKPASTPKQ